MKLKSQRKKPVFLPSLKASSRKASFPLCWLVRSGWVLFFFVSLGLIQACTLKTSADRGLISKDTRGLTARSEQRFFVPSPRETYQSSERVVEKNVTVGEHEVAYAGESMLRIKGYGRHLFRKNKVIAREDITLTGGMNKIRLEKGVSYPVIGTFQVKEKLYDLVRVAEHDALMIDSEGYIQRKVVYLEKDYRNLLGYDFTIYPRNSRLHYGLVRRVSEQDLMLNYELRYDGRDNRFFYLTFMDYMPGQGDRDGVFENLRYPLSTSSIEVRGVGIRILSTQSDRVDFIVLNEP